MEIQTLVPRLCMCMMVLSSSQCFAEKAEASERIAALKIIAEAKTPGQQRDGHLQLLKTAEKGDARAMTIVGRHHFLGEYGAEPDNELSAARIRKASEMGDGPAMIILANFCKNGIGTPQDDAQADAWARKGLKWCHAADPDDGLAHFSLAEAHAIGIWLPQDNQKAYEFSKKAAEAGLADGWTTMGSCHQLGFGTERDLGKARECFQKAADMGNAQAMGKLAVLMMQQELDPSATYDQVPAELISRVRELFRQGSWRGNADCMVSAAKLFLQGATSDDDERQAFLLFNQGALRNHGEALKMLGDCYRWGKGVMIDFQSAADCYQLAAQKGAPGALESYQKVLPLAQMTAAGRNVNGIDLWRSFQKKAAAFVSGLNSEIHGGKPGEAKK